MIQLITWSDRTSNLFFRVRHYPPCYRKTTVGNVHPPMAYHYDGTGYKTSTTPKPGIHAVSCNGQLLMTGWTFQESDLFSKRTYVSDGLYYYGFCESFFV